MTLRKYFVLLAVVGITAESCRDAVGPDCGRCLPVTALVVQGELLRLGPALPPAGIRMRLLDAAGPPRDSIAGCTGSVIRDTTLTMSSGGNFHALLIAGFPVFDVCLEVRAAPAVAGAFPPVTMGYPHLALRDTSMHDVLNIRLRVPYP